MSYDIGDKVFVGGSDRAGVVAARVLQESADGQQEKYRVQFVDGSSVLVEEEQLKLLLEEG